MAAISDERAVEGTRAPRAARPGFGLYFEHTLARWVYPLSLALLILLSWQTGVAALRVPEYVLPSPAAVVSALIERIALLNANAWPTIKETLEGFALAAGVAIPLAALVVSWRVFEQACFPLIVLTQTIPKVAVAPLFLVWFGFGPMPKILTAFLTCFFPIVVNSVTGFKSTEPNLVNLMKSMGAGTREIFFKVRLQRALPYIFAGLKVATTLAVIGAIVAEFVGSNHGLGFILLTANTNLETSLMFAALMYLSVLGAAFYFVIDFVERRCIPWHVSQRKTR